MVELLDLQSDMAHSQYGHEDCISCYPFHQKDLTLKVNLLFPLKMVMTQ